MRELTVSDIIRILRKSLAWILVIPVIAAAAGYWYYLRVPDSFRATTVLYVLWTRQTTDTITYDVSTSAQFAADYKELIKTEDVMERTKQLVGLENLNDYDVDITATSGTRVLNINVTGNDPVLCRDIANTISDVFAEYIERLTSAEAVRVAAKAQTPTIPVAPARLRNTALIALVALFGTAGIAIFIDMMNTTVRSDLDVKMVTDTPILAHINDYREDMETFDEVIMRKGAKRYKKRFTLFPKKKKDPVNGKTRKNGDANRIPSLYRTVNVFTREAIKTLVSNVQFSGIGDKRVSLVITSSLSNEGKSSCCVMMASALVEEGKKVLIVDMDFRNSSIAGLFRDKKPSGLIEYLQGRKQLNEVIVRDEVTGVDYIDNGRRNTLFSVVVKSKAFEEFQKETLTMYDYVLYDTPPIGLFVDSALLANRSDGTVLIVGQSLSTRDDLARSLEQLEKANAQLLGIAMNFVNEGGGSYYYYSRYGKYKYGKYGRYGYQNYFSNEDEVSVSQADDGHN